MQKTILLNATAILISCHNVLAQGVGNAAAQAACVGFPAGALKCLTDVSFVFCPSLGNVATEQFVAPGTRCAQGVVSQIIDHTTNEVATTTRIYCQFGTDGRQITAVFPACAAGVTAASSVASSSPAPSSPAASSTVSAPPAASSAPTPPAVTSSAATPSTETTKPWSTFATGTER